MQLPNSFHYTDMICVLRDYSKNGVEISMLFEVRLPEGADSDRYATEVERIPKDFLLKYLVATHYYTCVSEVAPNLIITDGGYFLFITVTAYEGGEYMKYVADKYEIFYPRFDNINSAVLLNGNFTEPVRTFKVGDAVVNGFFNFAYQLYVNPDWSTGIKSQMFGIEIKITCINIEELVKFKKDYDIRDHNQVFAFIKRIIDECTTSYKQLRDLQYEDVDDPRMGYRHFNYKFICISGGGNEQANRFGITFYVTGILDQYAMYQIARHSLTTTTLRPGIPTSADMKSWQSIDITNLVGHSEHNWDALRIPMETFHSFFYMTDHIQMVAKMTDYKPIVLDSTAWIQFYFKPYFINYVNGFVDHHDTHAYPDADILNPDCLIYRDGIVEIAFPISGVSPHMGVLFYGRIRVSDASVTVHLIPLLTADGATSIQLTGSTNSWVYFEVQVNEYRHYTPVIPADDVIANIFTLPFPCLGLDEDQLPPKGLRRTDEIVNTYIHYIEMMHSAENIDRAMLGFGVMPTSLSFADLVWGFMQVSRLSNPSHIHHKYFMRALLSSRPEVYEIIAQRYHKAPKKPEVNPPKVEAPKTEPRGLKKIFRSFLNGK